MATKSKSDRSLMWSIIAIVIAAVSIGYCSTSIIELVGTGVERSSRAIAYFTRLVKGSV